MSDHIYEAGNTKTTGAAAGPILTIAPGALTSASTRNPEIREIGIFIGTSPPATGPEISLGTPAAAGTGAATSVTVQALNPADPAGHTTFVSSYATTQPTAPTNNMRRAWLPNTTGAGIIWVWQPGEFILWQGASIAGAIVIWQLSALATVYDCYIKTAE